MTDELLCKALRQGSLSKDDYRYEAADRIEALTAEVGELQEVFDFQWRANMRAVEMWRAANPGNDLVLPDSAKLTVWLLERIEALTAKNEMLGREVNIARYGQPDFAWSVHVQVMDDLNAKLAKVVKALRFLEIAATGAGVPHPQERKLLHETIHKARTTLAEIEDSEAVTLGEKG